MNQHKTRHDENLKRLARAEGQVRGVTRMIERGDYCIDISQHWVQLPGKSSRNTSIRV